MSPDLMMENIQQVSWVWDQPGTQTSVIQMLIRLTSLGHMEPGPGK